MKTETRFRTDINGLRAVAVLAVLFYHFDVAAFRGGYVGVDVFFVISGFLMTQIVVSRLGEGRFLVLDFYAARVRRILPALIALGVVLLAAGFFWLIPLDYRELGREVQSALLFRSNFAYARHQGYFDIVSKDQWLLHTWSLSAEAQFYLIYPFILMALHRCKRLNAGIIALFAASLLLSGFGTLHDPTRAFFLLPTRVWEFLAGGLVFFLPRPVAHLEKVGLALILAAVFLYPDTLAYPGFYAVLPVAGAALVLAARSGGAYVSNRVLQFFGDISYSLYLWHWPVVLAVKYANVALTPLWVAAMTLASVALAWASYRWIETPFRHGARIRFIFLALAVVVVLAAVVKKSEGFPSRVDAGVRAAEAAMKDVNPRQNECLAETSGSPPCKIGANRPIDVALWGDSHADAVFTVVDDVLKSVHRGGVFRGLIACRPVVGEYANKEVCATFKKDSFSRIAEDKNIRDVLMVGRWTHYTGDGTDVVETICALRKTGKRVHVLAPVPEFDRDVPHALAKSRQLGQGDIDLRMTRARYAAQNAKILAVFKRAQAQCGVDILDPVPFLCNAEYCPAIRDGKPLWHDEQHLSRYGNSFLKPLFTRALD